MADQIQAKYDELGQIADRFANNSQADQEMIQKEKSSMEQPETGGWDGHAAHEFFGAMHGEVIPASLRLPHALDEANRITKQIVQIVKKAEHDASSRFRK